MKRWTVSRFKETQSIILHSIERMIVLTYFTSYFKILQIYKNGWQNSNSYYWTLKLAANCRFTVLNMEQIQTSLAYTYDIYWEVSKIIGRERSWRQRKLLGGSRNSATEHSQQAMGKQLQCTLRRCFKE